MIMTSFEAQAEKQQNVKTADKLEFTMKYAIYTLKYKRLASQNDEQTRDECIKSL